MERTVDKQEMALLQAERNRWREVFTRLVAIIQYLAERNMTQGGKPTHDINQIMATFSRK